MEGRKRGKYVYLYENGLPSLTYTMILCLEIECLLHESHITQNLENTHSLLVNFVPILPKSLRIPIQLTEKESKLTHHSSLSELPVL